MSPSTIQLTSAGLKDLDNDITEFSVDESSNLTKAAKDYLKTTRAAIKHTLGHMPPGSSISFSLPEAGEGADTALKWLQGWKERSRKESETNKSQSTSTSSHGREEGSHSRKRGRDQNVAEPAPKRPRQAPNRLIQFHFELLLDLLKAHPEVEKAVMLLQDSFTIVNAGSKSQIFQWHLKRVQGMVPDNAEISDAVAMLAECISYKDQL